MSKTENNILLFSITLCWAASYVFIKSLPSVLSTYAYLTLTCGIAAVLLTAVFFRKFKNLKPVTILKSAALSGLLLVNLIFDKLGINLLASSTASVLAATSILIVPFIMIIMRKSPTVNNIVGAVVIMAGIIITGGFNLENIFSEGALFMLLSSIFILAFFSKAYAYVALMYSQKILQSYKRYHNRFHRAGGHSCLSGADTYGF